MSINSAKYLKAVVPGADLPSEKYPIFAFIGRSNAGKSSFLNSITSQKGLAHSGATPGVTRKVNLYLVNKKYFFADLPGYGYAKMSRQDRNTLEKLIFWYLGHPENDFKQIFLLLDSRVGPTDDDLDIIDFLTEKGLPLIIVASKIDKLKSSAKVQQLKKISAAIPGHQIVPFSAVSGEGKKAIIQLLGI
jgi:GTP-binding protein